MMKKLFVLFVVIFSVCMVQAQKVKGDLSPLKGQGKVNVVFIYDGVTYDGDSEAKFFKDNKDHDDFEQWKTNWTSRFRDDLWEANFLEDLNDEVKGLRLDFGEYDGTTYTMIVKMIDIDPGSFAGPFSQPCKLTADVSFVKTGTTDSFATITFTGIAGTPMIPVIEYRVKAAFEEMGETVGEILKKKVK